jgi:integrase
MNLTKSDMVWEWLIKQQLKGEKETGEKPLKSFSKRKRERGSGLALGAIEKYKSTFNKWMEIVEKKTGKDDPIKVRPNDTYAIVQELILEYKNGVTSLSSFLRGLDDALHAFKEASKVSGVYKKEIRLGDKRIISSMLNKEKVFRRAKDTSVMQATREDMEKVVVEIERSRANQQAKDVAITVLKLEFATGRRVRALLRSKVGNFNPLMEQFVSFGDKGGKDNESFFLTFEAKSILEQLVLKPDGTKKKDGDMMFKIQYSQHKDAKKNGQDKKVDAMYDQIARIIRNSAKRAGVNRIEDNLYFSSHSCRKGFGVQRADFYIKNMTKNEREIELERRRQLDPKLSERIDKVMENIKGKFKIKQNADKRVFTDIEIVKLLVSTDINHSRIDVMRYYLMDYNFNSVF